MDALLKTHATTQGVVSKKDRMPMTLKKVKMNYQQSDFGCQQPTSKTIRAQGCHDICYRKGQLSSLAEDDYH